MTTYPNARRGDIWYVSDDALGGKNEDDRIIRGSRPVLIVSVDDHNFTSSCLTVVPISSGDRRIDGSDPSNVILHSKCLERKSARARRWFPKLPPSTGTACSGFWAPRASMTATRW